MKKDIIETRANNEAENGSPICTAARNCLEERGRR